MPRWNRSWIRTAFVCGAVLLLPSTFARAQSPLDGFDPGANDVVLSLAVQADGKTVVGGVFTTLGGASRDRIGRLNADGSIDTDFNPGANLGVFALAVQPDGKILVGGAFTMLGGATRNRIGRLNADGSIDTAFNPDAGFSVNALALQPDGKILVGGTFIAMGGQTRERIARLNSDGSLDATFNPGTGGEVRAIAVQPDGKIVVGGWFSSLGGAARSNLGRINADGTLDASFATASDVVHALVAQPDGTVVVGGQFTTLGGGARNRIGRINADGSLDAGFNPDANFEIYALAAQPDGRILVGGGFTNIGGAARSRLARLHAAGSIDVSFDPGSDNSIAAVAVQPDGKIVAGGTFNAIGGVVRSRIARLLADGTPEYTFTTGTDANGTIHALAVQADGRVVIGGAFNTLGGMARSRLARFHPDGDVDSTLSQGACCTSDGAVVLALAVQPDGKIVVGGIFSSLQPGYVTNSIGRLNPDGFIDATFNPGATGTVTALALQPDGKILVGGGFVMLGGAARSRIARLNADGTIDASFDPGANGPVSTIAVQPDGKILIGGQFTGLGGTSGTTPRNRIGRLESDGTVDASFNPGADNTVETLVLQPDGKILAGGSFTTLAGASRIAIGRLNTDGSIDGSFAPDATVAAGTASVYTLALQADGAIIAGGNFTTLGGATRNRIGRLTAAGAIDTTFNPGSSGVVNAVALQTDGKLLVAGSFTHLGGGTGTTARANLGRLTNTSSAAQNLSVSRGGGVLTWSRSGTAPELASVTFESSTDGTTFTGIGIGTRVAAGWQLSGHAPPIKQNLFLRAKGVYTTGIRNGSSSVTESVRNAYIGYLAFTDDDLTAGASVIKVVHITELRARIDALRAAHGLDPAVYTNSAIFPGKSVVQAVDILELRAAAGARLHRGRPFTAHVQHHSRPALNHPRRRHRGDSRGSHVGGVSRSASPFFLIADC